MGERTFKDRIVSLRFERKETGEREKERKDGNYLGARGGRANWTGEELATR